ncbi:MAG: ComEC/Rec2 family competence protein [Eubacteriales bacterium]|nr:ComEC/Rec2 family competence protein [Eubacteriales bacterium]
MGRRPMCLVCLLLMAAMCFADWLGVPLIRGNPLPDSVQSMIAAHPEAVVCGEAVRCADTEFSLSVYLEDVCILAQSDKISIQNVRVFLKEKEEVPPGTFLVLSGKLERVAAPRNPGEFDSQQYYACQHIYYFLKDAVIEKRSEGYSRYGRFLADMRERFTAILEAAAGEDAPVFEAMILGEKSSLEAETKLRYQMAGIIHILAISGLHISLLGAGLFNLMKKAGLGIGLSGFLSLAVMLQYGMMTGGSVSTMRAVCMFLLSVAAKMLGRIYDSMTALAVSAILLLMESPAYLYSSSFLLSFGAVLGIGVTGPVLCRIFHINNKRAEGFVLSLAVQLTTLPVVLMNYGEVSVAGVFLNLAVLPTVGAVLVSGICGLTVGIGSIAVARLMLLPGRGLLMLYEELCRAAGRLPFCTWIPGAPSMGQTAGYYLALGAGLAVGWYLNADKHPAASGVQSTKRRVWGDASKAKDRSVESTALKADKTCTTGTRKGKKKEKVKRKTERRMAAVVCSLGICLGIFILSFRPPGKLTITCLDVGQGDAIVLETPRGQHFLADCGSSNKKGVGQYQLLPFLKNQGISYLDAILVSHTDTDHISGIKELLEYMGEGLTTVRAGSLVLPDWHEPSEAYGELTALAHAAGVSVARVSQGDSIKADGAQPGAEKQTAIRNGDVRLTFLAPQEGSSGKDVNEEGMVFEISYGEFRGLFTGDIGEDTEKKLLSQGCLADIDFLKVGHHGSRYSSSAVFLDKIRPEIGVISCSSSNNYGHPSGEAVERLEAAGCHLEYTMKNGAIMVRTDGKSLTVERFLP